MLLPKHLPRLQQRLAANVNTTVKLPGGGRERSPSPVACSKTFEQCRCKSIDFTISDVPQVSHQSRTPSMQVVESHPTRWQTPLRRGNVTMFPNTTNNTTCRNTTHITTRKHIVPAA
jgi:hypothetical protein